MASVQAPADMDRDRKRALDEDHYASSKRMHLDRPHASGPSNGWHAYNHDGMAFKAEDLDDAKRNGGADEEDDDEGKEPAYKGLEAFRKEAIYRQMLAARREIQRAEQRARQYEAAVGEAEERTSSMNRFWSLLVEDVRLMFGDAVFSDDRSAFLDAIPLTPTSPSLAAFSADLQERSLAVRALLSRVVKLAPSNRGPDVDQLQARCHQLADEASDLRARLSSAIASRDRLSLELKTLGQALRKAEKRLDRYFSPTLQNVERPGLKAEQEAEQAKIEAAQAEKEAAERRKAAAEESSAGANGLVMADGATLERISELEQLVSKRWEESEALRGELAATRQEAERLQSDLHRIPDERVLQSALYRDLHQHFSHAKEEHERVSASLERTEAENADLREKREEFQQAAFAEANASIEELRSAIKAHEADVVRLRGQRDDLNAELMERRQRENTRATQIDEMKALVNAKESRILTLKSEVRRLQMTLAAKAGDSALVDKIKAAAAAENAEGKDAGEEEIEIIVQLQARLKAAEDSAADLQRQLEARSSSTTEADLAAKVSGLQHELDRLSGVIGEAGSGSDVASKLKEQQTTIEQLRLELSAANESTNALCEEVDKLSSAYAQVEKQANSKTYDVVRAEDKMARLMTEKSKADNKFFSAMRAKDALENERRVTMRNIERQLKVIERYADAEKSFAAQISTHEREVTGLRKLLGQQSARIAELERDVRSARGREQESGQQRAFAEERAKQHINVASEESSQRAAAEEKLLKLERELEKTKRALASAGPAAAGGGGKRKNSLIEGNSETDHLNALLRCSACKDRYRDRIIIKCLHTFCHDCLDARIQTRQRKCPHCAASFATSDVQPLYLQ